ncbi:hypothetical protein [Polymorphobacter megasporae]|uniref:hypothetical protein n=1 Tax=Glacieibacterium megasporae TaxID=2835787 RepID=UPI001C1E2F4E|nr:hypothetical protein [Polymorphobacter megasporae]UAJ09638.1 hypothetical protein KTC28_15200 [Polymorphobacter megasporae]
MSRTDSLSEVVPPLRPWQRRLYAGVAGIGGLAMVIAGMAQLATIGKALLTLPASIDVMTGTPGLLLMGVAIMGFGLFALLPPEDVPASGCRNRGGGGKRLNRGQRVVGVALLCLLLFPLCTVALRAGTADFLEAKGYHEEVIDTAVHSRFLTIRWLRPASGSH